MQVRHHTKFIKSDGTVLLDVDSTGKWTTYAAGNGADELVEFVDAGNEALHLLRAMSDARTAAILAGKGGAA
jgi:hypothetical protein